MFHGCRIKKKKNKQVLKEKKEKKEPKSGHFRARLKRVMQQITPARCDGTENPTPSNTGTDISTNLPTLNPSHFDITSSVPSNLPSSSISFTEKPLPAKSVLPSVYPTQVS